MWIISVKSLVSANYITQLRHQQTFLHYTVQGPVRPSIRIAFAEPFSHYQGIDVHFAELKWSSLDTAVVLVVSPKYPTTTSYFNLG